MQTVREVGDLPLLSQAQAMYISLLLDGVPEPNSAYEAIFGYVPDLEAWYADEDFLAALELADTDRPRLFHALVNTLFGKALRSLSFMMDNPRSMGKAVELLARLNGMLIDRVKDSKPSDLKELITLLRSKESPAPSDLHDVTVS